MLRDPVLKLDTKPIQRGLPVPNGHVPFLADISHCKVARPLYSSSTKTCCAKSAWFWICQCWCFNLSHLSYASPASTMNVAYHMCNDEQQCDCTWNYIHSHWVANIRSLAMSLTLIAIFLLLRQHQSMSMKVNQSQ